MSFEERISALQQKIQEIDNNIQTEEATKNALIMPFIMALGYDVFNPLEVVPEFTSDSGTKKGEKVDYAIKQNDDIIILIECKEAHKNLETGDNWDQLFRYFAVTSSKIAILTNGIEYWFYSDLVENNKLDEKPFLKLNLLNPKQEILNEVKKLAKDEFDLAKMLSVANELKYTFEFKEIINKQLEEPDEEFVRFFFKKALPNSSFTENARRQFKPLVKRAFQQLLRDRFDAKLRSALENEEKKENDDQLIDEETIVEEASNGIITTDEELQGYYIIRAILQRVIHPDQIYYKDTKNYFGIWLHIDKNKKQICRLWLNFKQKYLEILDKSVMENSVPIESVSDIYKYEEALVKAVKNLQ